MVYDIVIIDDNESTVQSIAQTIDWEQLGCQLVGIAFDGIEGRNLLLEKHPSIIITDIKMPCIDGLEMVALTREELPEAKVIIISGYEEFKYASRAIRLSVFDYILKPVDNDELEECVRQAVNSLDKEARTTDQLGQLRLLKQRIQVLSLLTNLQQQDCSIGDLFDACGLTFDGYIIIVGSMANGIALPTLRRVDDMETPDGLELLSLVADDYLVILVMWKGDRVSWQKDATRLVRQIAAFQPEISIAVSSMRTSYHEIRQAYQEARELLWEERFYNIKESIIICGQNLLPRTARIADIERVFGNLAECSNKGNDRLEEVLNAIETYSRGQTQSIQTIMWLYCTTLLRRQLASDQWSQNVDAVLCSISNIETMHDARKCLERCYRALEEALKDECVSPLVRSAMQYVALHALEGLKLESVADYFNVHPNYLSMVMHKETGITYQQHVHNIKMTAAKNMLCDVRVRMEDIAHAVGYKNYVSFYNIFKRREGTTPTEFRRRQANFSPDMRRM